jgi:hypothetical protein
MLKLCNIFSANTVGFEVAKTIFLPLTCSSLINASIPGYILFSYRPFSLKYSLNFSTALITFSSSNPYSDLKVS